jgi:hypothetical protein
MSNLYQLDNRRHAPALFITFFSHQNTSPYKYYLIRMSWNFNNRVPIIVPFFKYRSIPSFKKGTCTNYLYYIKGSSYTFNRDSYVPAVKAAAAPLNYEFKGTP